MTTNNKKTKIYATAYTLLQNYCYNFFRGENYENKTGGCTLLYLFYYNQRQATMRRGAITGGSQKPPVCFYLVTVKIIFVCLTFKTCLRVNLKK
jgi:hypothetical protein